MTRRTRRGSTLVTATLAMVLVLTGCAPTEPDDTATTPPAPRAITEEEAQLLAVVRFRNYDAGTRTIDAAYADSGHDVQLNGAFDYATHTGYATVATDGTATDLITWDGQAIAISPTPPASADPGEPPASIDGWTVSSLDATRSNLETVLAVLASLGSDRPENPLLLEQSDALWVREDTINGTTVTVFAGPSAGSTQAATASPDPDRSGIRYWVNDTGLALRVEVRLTDDWATIDLGDSTHLTISALLTTGSTGEEGDGG